MEMQEGGATMSYNEGGFGESSENRGFGGGRRFDDRPKPVETGKEYDVYITEISRKEDGIERIEGFVIFDKGGQEGQNVKGKITQVSRLAPTGDLTRESTPHPGAEWI